MCALSSRGAILRRQCDPVDVVRGLFSPESRRNLSAASVLYADGKIGGREGFFNWLKVVFNKSAENKSHEADATIIDRAATATTLDQPEIAASKRPVESPGKVDLVNQKLANFGVAQSMTRYEDGNHRVVNAKDDGRANAIQQLTIYAPLQSSRVVIGKTSWLDPGKVHRSERNGDMIEFAAKNDLNAAAHYRCYTSPRHCYRLPPRTKELLLGSRVTDRNISVPTRAIVGFAPRNSKPPIREPNMPEKRERKDERKDRKEKKKPIIRTDGESVDSSENRAEMVADDNPRGDLDTAFRYEWGVKLAEEPAAVEASDNDNFAEKGRRYVTKRLWGVKLKQPKPDVEDAASPTSEESPGRDAGERRNASAISKSDGDTAVDGTRTSNATEKEPDASSLKGTIAEYLSTPSHQTDLVSQSDELGAQEEKTDAISPSTSEDLRKIMRISPSVLKEMLVIDDEYNIPVGTNADAEISAWRNLAIRSRPIPAKEDFLSADNIDNLEMLSIRPEAPQPKLDVRTVRSTEDDLKDREVAQSDSGYRSAKSTEIKHLGSPRKPESYLSNKKMHTASTPIRYVHWHTSSIAFSTNPEDSVPRKVINDASNQQDKQQKDSDDFTRTSNVIADKEMEISSKQPQSAGHESRSLNFIVSPESTRKDESHLKDEDEIKHYEDPYVNSMDLRDEDATYVDLGAPTTGSDSIKSDATKSSGEESKSDEKSNKSATFDSSVEDVDDDSSKEYIVDGDYVRIPGDPYPYNKENLDKWRVPRSRSLIYKPIKRETSLPDPSARPTPRNVNDACASAAGESTRDSHAGAVMETSGSGDGAKNAIRTSGFRRASSRDQRVAARSDCLRDGDAADALGLRRWTEAFARLEDTRRVRTYGTARGVDNASLRAH